jgi:hypothetical protein
VALWTTPSLSQLLSSAIAVRKQQALLTNGRGSMPIKLYLCLHK